MKTKSFGCPGLILLTVMCAIVAGPGHQVFAERSIITDQGPLTGISASGEHEYLGIPYAAPPVGDLRWLPPQPPAPFNGSFQATQFGSRCTQLLGGVGPLAGSED